MSDLKYRHDPSLDEGEGEDTSDSIEFYFYMILNDETILLQKG